MVKLVTVKRSDVNLGHKGMKPPKPQRKPRATTKIGEMAKFILNYHGGDKEAAMNSINTYKNADSLTQDLILTGWICGKNIPARIAKSVFNIGDAKYKRIKLMRKKSKTGGNKPNMVKKLLI